MAIQWGDAAGHFRIGIDVSGKTLIVYAQSVGYGHDFSATLNLGGSWGGSVAYSFYSGFGATVTKEIYRKTVSANGTYSASTSMWEGTASVSRSVSFTAAPGAPTISGARTSDTDLTLSWSAVSGATSYAVQRLADGGSWITSAENVTATSKAMPNMPVNDRHYLRVYASNSGGNSQYSNTVGPFYSRPSTPSKPALSGTPSAVKLTFTNNAKYRFGVQVEPEGGTIQTFGTGTDGSWSSVTLSGTFAGASRFRVRAFAGPSTGLGRSYSAWSGWSASVQDVLVASPTVDAVVQRSTSMTPNPLGTNILVRAVGSVDTIAGNTLTVRARARERGASTWGGWVTNVAGGSPGAFDRSFVLSGVFAVTKAYEVEVSVSDAFSTVPVLAAVSTGEVAFAMGRAGAAAGRIYEGVGAFEVGGDLVVDGSVRVGDPNEIVIGGVGYQASGSWEGPFTLVTGGTGNIPQQGSSGVYRDSIILPAPYVPPDGWVFEAFTLASTGITVVQNAATSTSPTVVLRVVQVGSGDRTALTRIGWRLTKI